MIYNPSTKYTKYTNKPECKPRMYDGIWGIYSVLIQMLFSCRFVFFVDKVSGFLGDLQIEQERQI